MEQAAGLFIKQTLLAALLAAPYQAAKSLDALAGEGRSSP
jgi:hypothetical protein